MVVFVSLVNKHLRLKANPKAKGPTFKPKHKSKHSKSKAEAKYFKYQNITRK